MKHFQRFPDEASRIEHILFWLFPYEQDALCRLRTRADRAPHAPARKERVGQVACTTDVEDRCKTNPTQPEVSTSADNGGRTVSPRRWRGRRSSVVS